MIVRSSFTTSAQWKQPFRCTSFAKQERLVVGHKLEILAGLLTGSPSLGGGSEKDSPCS